MSLVMRIETTADETTVWLTGELDHHAARQLRQQVDLAVERTRPQRLRLDFSDVSFMDSSGIGLIMGRYRLMQLEGGTLVVTGASERLRKVMRLAGLDRLGILRETADSAQE